MKDYPPRDRLQEEEPFTDKAFPSPTRAVAICLLLWLLAAGLAASGWAVVRAEAASAQVDYEIAGLRLNRAQALAKMFRATGKLLPGVSGAGFAAAGGTTTGASANFLGVATLDAGNLSGSVYSDDEDWRDRPREGFLPMGGNTIGTIPGGKNFPIGGKTYSPGAGYIVAAGCGEQGLEELEQIKESHMAAGYDENGEYRMFYKRRNFAGEVSFEEVGRGMVDARALPKWLHSYADYADYSGPPDDCWFTEWKTR